MAPSKDWIHFVDNRLDNQAYMIGVDEFLNFAFKRIGRNEIRCPCVKCCNAYSGDRELVRTHLIVYGIMRNYSYWCHHGESPNEPDFEFDCEDNIEIGNNEGADEMQDILQDLYPTAFDYGENHMDLESSIHDWHEEPNEEAKRFYRLLKDLELPLYQNCKTSKLSALVKLLHIKTLGKWTNESFTMLLELLNKELLPDGSTLPSSYYEAKKIIQDLGLSYKKIDACVNDCMLYWKEDKDANVCKICGSSRWKIGKSSANKIPMKTMRYFPLTLRLQRLFMSSKTASYMRWHDDHKVGDGMIIHPAHGEDWKNFDKLHENFSIEPRNVRLALASDGFQPFAHSKQQYSIWPVFLIPLNLPPWMCMKEPNMILSMIIPGPDSVGDAIDVYLQPLIDELNDLWAVGVETYDASTKQNFNLRAALLWTINDFPAFGNLSGWSTKGKLACPCCHKDTYSIRLANCRKQAYLGHRRFLHYKHSWRNNKNSFDGTKEKRLAPKPLTGDEVLQQVANLEGLKFSKDRTKKVKISHEQRGDNWNKKSIFFSLPYWRTLLLRHNLDVMHIEKNICESLVGTIMTTTGKNKDTLNSRLDLQALNLRKGLHPKQNDNDKYEIPPATYTLSKDERHKLCVFLKELKVPDGFSSNISHCVNLKEDKILGLKSHDYHVLLQHILPLVLRGLLPKKVFEPLVELSMFFKTLCAKSLKLEDLKQIEAQIPITLCKLERVFPPALFDVMMHLPIHLVREAILGGPVQFRWMYPIERRLYTIKSYIRNRAHPEGSIAEGYIADECMSLCSRYLHDIETRFNRPERNYDGSGDETEEGLSVFSQLGRSLGSGKVIDLALHELEQAHIYILKNCEEVEPFISEYEEIEGSNIGQMSEKEWCRKFTKWFQNKVKHLYAEEKSKKLEGLLSLSRGPTQYVTSYNGYIMNGYRFHSKDHDKGLKTQNSGVVVVGDTGDGLSSIDYYGVLLEIVELQYIGARVPLFRCSWFDVHDKTRGIKTDEYGFNSVNCQRLKTQKEEPFVLAKQAMQAFFINDHLNKGWQIVVKNQARDAYYKPKETDLNLNEREFDSEAHQLGESSSPQFINLDISDDNEEIDLVRKDIGPTVVSIASLKRKR